MATIDIDTLLKRDSYTIEYAGDTFFVNGNLISSASTDGEYSTATWADANTASRKSRLSARGEDILTYDRHGTIVRLADYGEHTDIPAYTSKKPCAYCGSTSPDDRRGNCAACGGPRT
jgi:hypothetical protein